MNFKMWFESYGLVTSPWEALEILGLTSKVGVLTEPDLMQAYRKAALAYHPDRTQHDNSFIKRINSAREVLEPYIGQSLPLKGQLPPKGVTQNPRKRPEGSQIYNEQQFKDWVQELFNGGYFQAYVKTKLPWVPMTAFDGVAGGPIGSREMSRKLKPTSAGEFEQWIKMMISHDFAGQPLDASNIVYLGIKPQFKPATAWITYIIPRDRGWERDLGAPVDDYHIRCIEFVVPVIREKPKIAEDALKSRAEIEGYLRSKADTGIRKIPTTTHHSYWGLEQHMQGRTPKGYLIEITNSNFNIVRRYTLNTLSFSYKKETKVTKLESIPFSRSASRVTPALVDRAIAWVKDKFEKKGFGE